MIGFDRLLQRFRRERLLFSTSKAPFQDTAHQVGATVAVEGELYRVTRWLEVEPVSLPRGGSTRRWEVWGRPLSDEELRRELDEATRSMLGG